LVPGAAKEPLNYPCLSSGNAWNGRFRWML
jgi:hypothetical protein